MIVLFLSCGVIYLKYYAVRIWAGFPGTLSLRMRPLLVWFMGYLRLQENTQGTTSKVIKRVTFISNAMKLGFVCFFQPWSKKVIFAFKNTST